MPPAGFSSSPASSLIFGLVAASLITLSIAAPAIAQPGAPASSRDDDRVCADVDGVMPAHVVVREPFPHVIRDMLTYSPTFRAQCGRLAAATQLRVVMRVDLRSCRSDYAARTVFTYGQDGQLFAHIDFQLRANYAPIVAHEFEHVLEQLDRWHLKTLADDEDAGVCEIEPGVFETDRAVKVGNAVEAEMFGRRRTTQALPPRQPSLGLAP